MFRTADGRYVGGNGLSGFVEVAATLDGQFYNLLIGGFGFDQPGLLRFGLRFILGKNAGDTAEVVLDPRLVRVLIAKLTKLGPSLRVVFRFDKPLYLDQAISDRALDDKACRRVLFTLFAGGGGAFSGFGKLAQAIGLFGAVEGKDHLL